MALRLAAATSQAGIGHPGITYSEERQSIHLVKVTMLPRPSDLEMEGIMTNQERGRAKGAAVALLCAGAGLMMDSPPIRSKHSEDVERIPSKSLIG